MKKIMKILGIAIGGIGIILALMGTIYEYLPNCFRYSSLIGIILFIFGLILVGSAIEMEEEGLHF